MGRTIYIVVSWVDPRRRHAGTREYGSRSTKQAAIRLAERVLPPATDYIVTTISRTVHTGRTPGARQSGEPPQRRR